MKQLKARELLGAIFGRDDDAAVLSRRNVLAGLGLVGAAVAAPQLLSATAAEAKPLATPGQDAPGSEAKASEGVQATADVNAETASDATDLSAQRWRWRRRRYYWRRPRRYIIVRRRYWRRRRYW